MPHKALSEQDSHTRLRPIWARAAVAVSLAAPRDAAAETEADGWLARARYHVPETSSVSGASGRSLGASFARRVALGRSFELLPGLRLDRLSLSRSDVILVGPLVTDDLSTVRAAPNDDELGATLLQAEAELRWYAWRGVFAGAGLGAGVLRGTVSSQQCAKQSLSEQIVSGSLALGFRTSRSGGLELGIATEIVTRVPLAYCDTALTPETPAPTKVAYRIDAPARDARTYGVQTFGGFVGYAW